MSRAARLRFAVAGLGAGLATTALVAWLVTSLAGADARARLGPVVVELGRPSLLRFAAWALLAAVWLHPARGAWLERVGQVVAGVGGRLALGLLAALLVAFKVAQHLGFRTAGYDLSLYHWAVHHAWGPPWLEAYGLGRNYFSEHFSPVLLLFAPVERLVASPLALVVPLALGCAAGVGLVFRAARAFHLGPLAAACLALTTVTSTAWWAAFDFDFHPEVLVLPFAAGFVWAMREGRAVRAATFALLLLSVKEDAALLLLVVAGWLAWVDPARRRWCAWAAALAVLWLVLAVAVFIPAAVPPDQPTWRMLADRYGDWGQSYGEVASNVLRHPLRALDALVGALGPLLRRHGYTPLLAPAALLASLPVAGLHALSRFDEQASLWGYYALPALTVWALGVARAAGRLEARFGPAVGLTVALVPLLLWPAASRVDWPSAEDSQAHAVLGAWPQGVKVAAQNALVPHLPVSAAVLDLRRWAEADAVVLRPQANRWPLGLDEYLALGRRLLEEEGFGVERLEPGLAVLRRGGGDPALAEEVQAWLAREAAP